MLGVLPLLKASAIHGQLELRPVASSWRPHSMHAGQPGFTVSMFNLPKLSGFLVSDHFEMPTRDQLPPPTPPQTAQRHPQRSTITLTITLSTASTHISSKTCPFVGGIANPHRLDLAMSWHRWCRRACDRLGVNPASRRVLHGAAGEEKERQPMLAMTACGGTEYMSLISRIRSLGWRYVCTM